ncbi:MAG: DNA polymerase I, partial [Ruminococcaceae bacterium]|nr:DNA polymerase I [Oscillospiraceae bacterium]
MELLAIDGNSIVNRAFYGVRPLTTRDGRPTHAIYGFLTMLGKIIDDTKPDAVAVAFDMRAPTFRHKKYSGYKAKRKGMPDELASQLQPLKDILTALGYVIVTAEGWEADDILGTLARACGEQGSHCTIATGDRDTLQLISANTAVRLLSTKEGKPTATICDEQYVMDNYGVTPPQMRDIKAIQGDTSDSIPGVPGIGEKGARELITRFGSLDGVYASLDDPSIKAGMRKKLEEGRDSAYLSYWLGTVQTDAPVDTDPAHYALRPVDSRTVRRLMTDLELFSILKRLNLPEDSGAPVAVSDEQPQEEETAVEFATLEQCLSIVRENSSAIFSYDINDSESTALEQRISSAVLCEEGKVYLLRGEESGRFLAEICADGTIAKSTHDLKRLTRLMLECGQPVPQGFVMDTMLAAY